jgi:lipopolysaccharide biosynthesis glycosyltransferase
MYLCDDFYAHIAGISILSLFENNKDIDDIHIFLVGDSIKYENIQKLYQTAKIYDRELTILEKPNIKELIGCNVEMHWWIENVFSRVFLGELFRSYPEVKKLIYIDCDTLVVGSLRDLWETELENNVAAGVLEAMGNFHKLAIGLRPENAYFNAGVFLINVEKWKKECYDKKASDFVKKLNGKMEYADESVLNGIASWNMKIISPKYNLTSLSIYFSIADVKKYRKTEFHYTESERHEALKDARIVHFTSTFMDVRPWVEGSRHPYAEIWNEYKSKSMWSDTPMQKDNRSKKKILLRKLAMLLPHDMRLMCTGFIHAYIKPLKYLKYYYLFKKEYYDASEKVREI